MKVTPSENITKSRKRQSHYHPETKKEIFIGSRQNLYRVLHIIFSEFFKDKRPYSDPKQIAN